MSEQQSQNVVEVTSIDEIAEDGTEKNLYKPKYVFRCTVCGEDLQGSYTRQLCRKTFCAKQYFDPEH